MVDKEIIRQIESIVEEAANMRYSYFWSLDANASIRGAYERRHSHEKVEWEEGGHIYTAAYNVSTSRKNIYASGYYTKDGKKTNLTAIKNSLKRLKESE